MPRRSAPTAPLDLQLQGDPAADGPARRRPTCTSRSAGRRRSALHGELRPLRHPAAAPGGPEAARRAADDAAAGEGVRRAQGVPTSPSACPASAASACNVYQQRGTIALRDARHPLPGRARSRSCTCRRSLEEIALRPRGLVLVTGITGSGKSTALAAMIQHINEHRHANIITIEDPIEFLHRDINCHINQREVGTDTASFAQALRRVLRQDPDVILDRRDPRPRDAGHGAQGGRHRPPGVLDAAHDGRDADDQPRALVLPAAPAGRGALHRSRARCRPSSRCASCRARTSRAACRRARCSSTPPRCATRSATCQVAQHPGPDQRRHGAVRHAELRPVADERGTRRASSRTRARCSTRRTRASSRCACRAWPAPATRARGRASRKSR